MLLALTSIETIGFYTTQDEAALVPDAGGDGVKFILIFCNFGGVLKFKVG